MSQELVSTAEALIRQSDNGSFRIPYDKLLDMGYTELKNAEDAVMAIIQLFPDYEFCAWDDWDRRDRIIEWRRSNATKHRTDEGRSISRI